MTLDDISRVPRLTRDLEPRHPQTNIDISITGRHRRETGAWGKFG